MEELEQAMADYAHEAWAGWMRYLFKKGSANSDGSFTIDSASVDRWRRQMETPYAELSPEEQRSDIKEGREILDIVSKYARIELE